MCKFGRFLLHSVQRNYLSLPYGCKSVETHTHTHTHTCTHTHTHTLCLLSRCTLKAIGLANSIEKRPSFELTVPWLVEKFPHKWNTMFHYSDYRSSALTLTWARSTHSIYYSVTFHILLQYMLRYCKWPFPSGFPNKTQCSPLLSPHTYPMSRPSHSSWFDCLTNIYRGMHIVKLLNIQFTPITIYLVSFRSKHSFLRIVFLRHFPRSSLTHTKERETL